MRPALLAALALALPGALAHAPAAATMRPNLVTHAEESQFRETGRYDETVRLCEAFQQAFPNRVRCTTFGTTPEGRPMLALVASDSGALDAAAARARGLPVVLVQGGIHAGEIDGKDAGFLALREVLDGDAAKDALKHQVLVFVPVFNVDGHERFGRWNRPNQRGPEEMGWRTTAQNLNLNRDYMKAESPEMRAMLRLVGDWDPLLMVDLHATNGAQFEHDISVQVEPVHAGDAALRKAGRALRDGVLADLAKAGSMPLPFYPSFVTYDDPASGFEDNVATPRFSHGYFWLRNRIGMLVETHSWRTYPERVRSTRNTVVSVLEHVAKDGARWRRDALAADTRAAALGGTRVPLDFRASPEARTIDFRGYAYTRTPSEVSGALMTRYDETTPQVWKVPLRDRVAPSLEVDAPRGGWIVPAAHAERLGALLALHGVEARRLDAAPGRIAVQAFRVTKATPAATSTEGHHRVAVEGAWAPETRAVGAGALYVPVAQPRARIAIALLEPQAPDSVVAWGGFANAFERKEYIEDYVAEQVAREMLRDPAVQAEFDAALAADPAFAKNPQARLGFFAKRHPSWDERWNLYPVLRVDAAP